ncbi:MAG: energy-coupling factor transporter ATPase [bacterium]|nr:energy-coupling factor transporter ATPase [bacterium]
MITVKNLSFSYSSNPDKTLKNISLEILPGEFVVIMGQDGAGKSTLLKTFNGVIPHLIKGKFEGEVFIDGKNTQDSSVRELSSLAGLVFQDFETQIFSTRVNLEIAFGPENLGLSWDEIDSRIRKNLEIVGLNGFERRNPLTLSGGEKQRLCIGSVLALEPKAICLDEPTTDLDPQGKEEIFSFAKKYFKNRKLTYCLVEHESEEILQADKIIILREGEIKAAGVPGDILKNTELLSQNGIKQPQLIELNNKFDFPIKDFADVNEVCRVFKSRGNINTEKYSKIRGKDKTAGKSGIKALEAEDLCFSYESGKEILSGINLEIFQGEFIGILGANGSGKTSLIKHFNGLNRPAGGNIKIFGKNIQEEKLTSLGRKVGYVFQNPDNQIFCHTVEDEVGFGPGLLGLNKKEVDERVEESLAAVSLSNYRGYDPFSLTKGQRQRLAVASVLASRPEIIILDEPTTGLDYLEIRSIMSLIEKLNRSGYTIIMVTHAVWVAAEYASRLIIMKNGKIIEDGTAREVLGKEGKLRSSSVKLPPLVKLSNQLGATLLNVEEFTDCYECLSI